VQTIIASGMKDNPLPNGAESPGKHGRLKRSKAHNFVQRLAKLQEEALGCLYNFRIPFDNNLPNAT
jgi:hypothetical protein